MGIAEGIETAMSAMQLFDLPCWAAIGCRLNKIELPEFVSEIVIFADNGAAGRDIAMRAVRVFTARGRKVTMRRPPDDYGDWNDALRALEMERAQ